MLKRALIVDDERDTCDLLERFLSFHGIEALTVTESDLAVGHLWAEKFLLIVLDARMPQPSGIKLAAWARKAGINQHTPIAILSDDEDRHALSKSFEAGANLFLHKPIDETKLMKLIGVATELIEYEKRRFTRVRATSKIRLSQEAGDLHGETIDVSLNGMLVKCGRIVPPGTRTKVDIHLREEEDPIQAWGTIMRVAEHNQMGVRLDRFKTNDQTRLEGFLLGLADREYGREHAAAS